MKDRKTHNKLYRKLHLDIFKSDFESICILSLLIVFSDMIWLFHDIVANGLNLCYIIIGSGLLIGLIGILIIAWRHHKKYILLYRNNLLNSRIKINKLLLKRRRNRK